MPSFKSLYRTILAICLLLMVPFVAPAQLSLNGEFRPRTEFRNGYRILNTSQNDPAFFTSQRTRLNALYEQDRYLIKIAAQDIRTWGEVDQLQDTPNVNIHEAWAQLNLSDRFRIKLGRQELVYNDHRLLGNVNWTQQARSHDALLVKYHDSRARFQIDLGATYNQEGENLLGNTYSIDNYKVLSYAWISKDFGALDASALLLTDGFEVPTGAINYRYTYGTHLNYFNKAWKFAGTFYLQNGDDATRRNISAYMVAAKASCSLSPFTFTAGYDYLSGGKAGDRTPRRHTFSTLYATNHKFYGHMDYFLNIPADTRGGGLQDLYLKTGYAMSARANLDLTYHHFALANSIADPLDAGQTLDQNLVSEFDFSFSYGFAEDITFRLGYSVLFSYSSLERIQARQADGLQQWGWAMLVLTPEIVK